MHMQDEAVMDDLKEVNSRLIVQKLLSDVLDVTGMGKNSRKSLCTSESILRFA